jgi:hypothetical protein
VAALRWLEGGRRRDMSSSAAVHSWWRAAIACVMDELPSRFGAKARKNIRAGEEYGGLFKRRYAAGRPWLPPLTHADEQRLAALEEDLPLQMTIAQRNAAWHELCAEELCKDSRGKDLVEMEAQLRETSALVWQVGTTAAQPQRGSGVAGSVPWDAMPPPPPYTGELALAKVRGAGRTGTCLDEVYFADWLHFASESNSLKRRWLVVADVASLVATRHAGWLTLYGPVTKGRQIPTKGTRLWWRLRASELSFYTHIDDKKPRGIIGISSIVAVASGVTTEPDGSALGASGAQQDCFFTLTVRSGTHSYHFETWVLQSSQVGSALAWQRHLRGKRVDSRRPPPPQRWLLVFETTAHLAAKPLDVIPLSAGSYQLLPPKKARRGFAEHQQVVIRVVQLDGTIRKCILAYDAASSVVVSSVTQLELVKLLLLPKAAMILNTDKKTGARGMSQLSAIQQALVDGTTKASMEEEEEVEHDEHDEYHEMDGEYGVDEAPEVNFLLRRFGFSFENISISLGIDDYDWMELGVEGLQVLTVGSERGSLLLAISAQELHIDDRYSRDTCFPRLLGRLHAQTETSRAVCAPRVTLATRSVEPPILQFTYVKVLRGWTSLERRRSLSARERLEWADADTSVTLVTQPFRMVFNPELVPILFSFIQQHTAAESVPMSAVQRLQAENEAVIRWLQRTYGGVAKYQQWNEKQRRQRIEVRLGTMELIFCDDLSKLRQNAKAVVLRMESLTLGDPDSHRLLESDNRHVGTTAFDGHRTTSGVLAALSSADVVQWMWGDAGIGNTGLTRSLARSNPLRWDRGPLPEIVRSLEGRLEIRPVDLKVHRIKGSKVKRSFESPVKAAEWLRSQVKSDSRTSEFGEVPVEAISAATQAAADAAPPPRPQDLSRDNKLKGKLRHIELFCSHRDDFEQDVQQVLQPVTASLQITSGSAGSKWASVELDIDSVQLRFSKAGTGTLIDTAKACWQTVQKRRLGAMAALSSARQRIDAGMSSGSAGVDAHAVDSVDTDGPSVSGKMGVISALLARQLKRTSATARQRVARAATDAQSAGVLGLAQVGGTELAAVAEEGQGQAHGGSSHVAEVETATDERATLSLRLLVGTMEVALDLAAAAQGTEGATERQLQFRVSQAELAMAVRPSGCGSGCVLVGGRFD